MTRCARSLRIAPVLALAVAAADRKDDVKLGQSLLRLGEEDPSLTIVHHPDTHEVVLWGQGEMHLRVALERLRGRFGVNVNQRTPAVGYRETIRKSATQRGRHKKQSGGHGQFGDVVLEIKAAAARRGLQVRGASRRRRGAAQLHPGGRGGRPRCAHARAARLPGGRHRGDADRRLLSHRRTPPISPSARPARIGVSEALPECQPVLLEPIHTVEIVCPTDATARINAILSGRRGQILVVRHPRGLAGLGHGARDAAGGRDRRPDHRGAVGDDRRRQLHDASSITWRR